MSTMNIITIVAPICVVALTAYGLYAKRRQNRLSVTPHLADYTNTSTTNEGMFLSYDLSNNGVGLARIRSFVLSHHGKPFPKGKYDYVETFVRAHLGTEPKYDVRHTFNFGEDDSLKPGDTRNMLTMLFLGAKRQDRETILRMFEGIGIRIEYESLYGEKFILERKNEDKLMDAPSR